jgi:hypothetical protein
VKHYVELTPIEAALLMAAVDLSFEVMRELAQPVQPDVIPVSPMSVEERAEMFGAWLERTGGPEAEVVPRLHDKLQAVRDTA